MKWIRTIISLVLVFIVFYSFTFGYKKIDEEVSFYKENSFKGVITLWQIDSFEGGNGSRKQYLNRIARQFERENQGVYIMAIDMTMLGANLKLEQNEYPDLISYGVGLNYIDNIKEIDIDCGENGGSINGKTFAVPWCKGGYFLIKNNSIHNKKCYKNSIIIGDGDGICPSTCYALMNKTFENVFIYQKETAFNRFLTGESEYYLGTQRDIVRLTNRNFDFTANVIEEFNDIFQYISIMSCDESKIDYAKKFIELLISEESQKKLNTISMFSPYFNIEYDNSVLNSNQYFGNYLTFFAIYSEQDIKNIKNLSSNYLSGDKSALTKIKNSLI